MIKNNLSQIKEEDQINTVDPPRGIVVFSVPTYVDDMIFLLSGLPLSVHVNATKGFCLFCGTDRQIIVIYYCKQIRNSLTLFHTNLQRTQCKYPAHGL